MKLALNEEIRDSMTGGSVQAEFFKSQNKLTQITEGISWFNYMKWKYAVWFLNIRITIIWKELFFIIFCKIHIRKKVYFIYFTILYTYILG